MNAFIAFLYEWTVGQKKSLRSLLQNSVCEEGQHLLFYCFSSFIQMMSVSLTVRLPSQSLEIRSAREGYHRACGKVYATTGLTVASCTSTIGDSGIQTNIHMYAECGSNLHDNIKRPAGVLLPVR